MNEKVYRNNSGDEFIVLAKKVKRIKNRVWPMSLIQFLVSGSTKWVYDSNLLDGKVRDCYKPIVYGVGYQGEHDKPYYWKQAKTLWRNMLKRCYTDDPKGYQKWGTTVDPHWHCFANFLRDIPKLDNFDKWLEGGKRKLNDYNLDKDLKHPGCNVYSPHTCSFVHESINKSEGAKTTVAGYFRTIGGR